MQRSNLFDHLVGALLEEPGHVEADFLGGLEVDRQHERGGELHGQVTGLFAAKNAMELKQMLCGS